MIYKLGPRKAEILRDALSGEWFQTERQGTLYGHCVKLFQRGYLRRDCPDIYRFQITDEGRAALNRYDLAEAA